MTLWLTLFHLLQERSQQCQYGPYVNRPFNVFKRVRQFVNHVKHTSPTYQVFCSSCFCVLLMVLLFMPSTPPVISASTGECLNCIVFSCWFVTNLELLSDSVRPNIDGLDHRRYPLRSAEIRWDPLRSAEISTDWTLTDLGWSSLILILLHRFCVEWSELCVDTNWLKHPIHS